jgi:transcriptional regulator with XRE-family HTH domain
MAIGDRDRIETLPDKLRELRAARGLSQAALAELAGLGVGDVSKYEAGHRTPGLRVAALLAGALGCTVDEMLAPVQSATEKKKRGRPKKVNL